MIPASGTVAPALSHGDALSLLLGVEGFLLAAVALAVTLAAPNQPRQGRYKWLSPALLMNVALGILALVAVGSGFAWAGLASDDSFHRTDGIVVGGALVVAIVGMPLVAAGLVLGSKRA